MYNLRLSSAGDMLVTTLLNKEMFSSGTLGTRVGITKPQPIAASDKGEKTRQRIFYF